MSAFVADHGSTKVRSSAGATRESIEAAALKVLQDSGIPLVAPINLQALAEARRVKVYQARFADSEISGMLSLDTKHNPKGVVAGERGTIFLNTNHYPTRQSFTLAHELGHLELGHYERQTGFLTEGLRFRSGNLPYDPIEEREANQFAAALLMPNQLFRDVMAGCDFDVAEAAVLFGVSVQAASIRASDLGLLKTWGTLQE